MCQMPLNFLKYPAPCSKSCKMADVNGHENPPGFYCPLTLFCLPLYWQFTDVFHFVQNNFSLQVTKSCPLIKGQLKISTSPKNFTALARAIHTVCTTEFVLCRVSTYPVDACNSWFFFQPNFMLFKTETFITLFGY